MAPCLFDDEDGWPELPADGVPTWCPVCGVGLEDGRCPACQPPRWPEAATAPPVPAVAEPDAPPAELEPVRVAARFTGACIVLVVLVVVAVTSVLGAVAVTLAGLVWLARAVHKDRRRDR